MLPTRRQQILAAIVEQYIETGEPVGSKALLSKLDINVSSATIRNDMADLTAQGYLTQPHTSAGRIPTQAGYRYYVDNLMNKNQLDEEERWGLRFFDSGTVNFMLPADCANVDFSNVSFVLHSL